MAASTRMALTHVPALAKSRAETPAGVAPVAWWAVAKAVWLRFGRDRVMDEAASVSFFTLLALVPTLIALLALYGMLVSPAELDSGLGNDPGLLPKGGLQLLQRALHNLDARSRPTLGLGLGISLATVLWSSNNAVRSLLRALNIVYGLRERRSLVRLLVLTLGLTTGSLVLVVATLAVALAVPPALQWLHPGAAARLAVQVLRWPLLTVAAGAFLSVMYCYGPSRDAPRWRWVTPGSLSASVVWMLGSVGYSWYVLNFERYDVAYGSLGAGVGLLTWMWLSAVVVLVGAQLNAEIERQSLPVSARAPGQAKE